MKTKISLILEEQSDQGLHCLQLCKHFWWHYYAVKHFCSDFRGITTKFENVSKFWKNMVNSNIVKLLDTQNSAVIMIKFE